MKKEYKEFLKDIGGFISFVFASVILGVLMNKSFSYLSSQKDIVENTLFICSYLYIMVKAIRGNYVFSKPIDRLKNLGIILTVLAISFFVWLNNSSFSYQFGSYTMEREVSRVFENYTGLDDSYWLIISPIFLYIIYILIGLSISAKNKDLNNVLPVTLTNNLSLLIQLKESGKLTSEDFFDEVKKLKEK